MQLSLPSVLMATRKRSELNTPNLLVESQWIYPITALDLVVSLPPRVCVGPRETCLDIFINISNVPGPIRAGNNPN